MAHPTALAVRERAPDGVCLQCFARQEQLEKCSLRNVAIQDLLTYQLDHPTSAVVSKQTRVFDLPRLVRQHLGPSANRLAQRFANHFSLLVVTIRPSTFHGDSTPNVAAGYLQSRAALMRHRNIFDIGTLGSEHDGLLLILPSHDYVFLERARFCKTDAGRFARSEACHIMSGSTAHRGGAAAGVSLVDWVHTFRAFTNATRGVSTLCTPPTPTL